MFSIKPCLGGWIASDGSGERFNGAQAARKLYHESASFMDEVKKRLQLDQCSVCNSWGKLGSDIHVLHAGARPVCGKPDCIGSRFMDDYGSVDIIEAAILGRQRRIDEKAWETITAIEPMIRFVREFMDRAEIGHGVERNDERIRRRFKEDFREIDACTESAA